MSFLASNRGDHANGDGAIIHAQAASRRHQGMYPLGEGLCHPSDRNGIMKVECTDITIM
jgi:hypothetical protein